MTVIWRVSLTGRNFEGNGPVKVTVTGFGPSSTCLSEIPNYKAILLVTRNPSGQLQLNYEGISDAVVVSNPEVVGEIIKATKTSPFMILINLVILVSFTGLMIVFWGQKWQLWAILFASDRKKE